MHFAQISVLHFNILIGKLCLRVFEDVYTPFSEHKYSENMDKKSTVVSDALKISTVSVFWEQVFPYHGG